MSIAQTLLELQELGPKPYKRKIMENKADQSAYNQATTTVTPPFYYVQQSTPAVLVQSPNNVTKVYLRFMPRAPSNHYWVNQDNSKQ